MSQGTGFFRKAALLGLGVTAGVSTHAGQAQAQWYGFRHQQYYAPPVVEPDEMTPRELAHAVRSQGFNQPSRPVYHDEVAVVTAVDRGGQRVRLTLDVFSGQIVNLSPLGPVPRVMPRVERHQAEIPRERPDRERPRIVQRAPDQGAAIRGSVPNQDTRARATPENPTIVRRAPLLPPQPGTLDKQGAGAKPDPAKPNQTQAGPSPAVGVGTKAAPRRIDLAPSAAPSATPDTGSKAPATSPALSTTPPI
jgi:hypothetical protein